MFVIGKILLQQAWKEAGQWYKTRGPDLCERIVAWWGEISKLNELCVPRWVSAHPDCQSQIHLFTDASEVAYGCCVYLVVNNKSQLLYAKSRVAPLKIQTMTRFELQAAFLGSNWTETICEQMRLQIGEVHAWTDSSTVCHWLKRPAHHWKTFVANRVASINAISQKLNITWRHCPGACNPTDLASRGVTLAKLKEPFWLHGPKWLVDESKWPVSTIPEQDEIIQDTLKQQALLVNTLQKVNPW